MHSVPELDGRNQVLEFPPKEPFPDCGDKVSEVEYPRSPSAKHAFYGIHIYLNFPFPRKEKKAFPRDARRALILNFITHTPGIPSILQPEGEI